MKQIATFAGTAGLALVGCGDKTDAEFRAEVIAEIHESIAAELDDLVNAAHEIQVAAPTHAWDSLDDANAMAQMRDAWRRTRIAYEHVEGATSPLFHDLDISLDARYNDYLEMIGPGGDHDLFDATGVVGMHAIERILYSAGIRPAIITYESRLDGYEAAAYPASEAQAIAFKTLLVQKLVDDTTALRDQWQPHLIDVGVAYRGLVGLMNEQELKIDRAASGAEESRYANITLFDLRNNLAGTKGLYDVFRQWIWSRPTASDAQTMIETRFRSLTTLYGAISGDALPAVPAGWSSMHPSQTDLSTPFGTLWQAVQREVDPTTDGSIVFEMNRIAKVLGLPEFADTGSDTDGAPPPPPRRER
jgi:iron uptake system component EfeO